MAGRINGHDLMRRLHRRLTVVNHIYYSIFRFQKRQKHYKSSDKVIYVLKTAMVKRKPKIRSENSSTCIREKHFYSWTSFDVLGLKGRCTSNATAFKSCGQQILFDYTKTQGGYGPLFAIQ